MNIHQPRFTPRKLAFLAALVAFFLIIADGHPYQVEERALRGYIYHEDAQSDLLVFCLSYETDVKEYGEAMAPGYCYASSLKKALEGVKRQHLEKLKETSHNGP